MIIEQTFKLLKSIYGNKLEKLIISDAKIGLHLTAVRLSDNSIGTASTLVDDHPLCAKSKRDFGDFTPLKIKGQRVLDILETKKESNTISSLKTAVLNAVSSKIISSGNYKIIENCDPIQLIDLSSRKTITIVGAFQSYIRKISETENKLFVLELRENALSQDQKKLFVPAGEYKKILSVSDIVIITGQTLVNRTIDDLLSSVSPDKQVIVTGPSGSILPDILFENNVSIIGATRITNAEILFDIVSEGGAGYHLFEYCAQKICILKGDGA
ncbi:MAG TPA: DUF364 domain-containing protein [Bacteroidales bacterium]|nr:DUF364 domain-containing protein [Bacteroidales bacterium]